MDDSTTQNLQNFRFDGRCQAEYGMLCIACAVQSRAGQNLLTCEEMGHKTEYERVSGDHLKGQFENCFEYAYY